MGSEEAVIGDQKGKLQVLKYFIILLPVIIWKVDLMPSGFISLRIKVGKQNIISYMVQQRTNDLKKELATGKKGEMKQIIQRCKDFQVQTAVSPQSHFKEIKQKILKGS